MKKAFLWYICFLAKLQLKKTNPLIIGIAGASGKTSVSSFIKTILQEKYKTRSTKGKNSETGIPLSVLDINIKGYSFLNWIFIAVQSFLAVIFDWQSYDILIAEMGIDRPFEPKNMSFLLKIIKPSIAVLTNIEIEHSQYFDSLVKEKKDLQRKKELLEKIGKEESLLFLRLGKNSTAIVNLDDRSIESIKTKANRITVSFKDKHADFYIIKYEVDISSSKFSFVNKNKEYALIIPQPLPSHYGYSLLMAVAACQKAGVDILDSVKILSDKFSLPAGRVSIFEGIKDTILIDSSYNNATLMPILDLLSMLKAVGGQRRKVVILGDLRELGSLSGEFHKQVAKKVVESSDFAVLVGPLMHQYAGPVLANNKFNFVSFENFSKAKDKLKDLIRQNDLVLIKGSQNTLFLERAVEILLKNKKDKDKLCRRGKLWDSWRAKTS